MSFTLLLRMTDPLLVPLRPMNLPVMPLEIYHMIQIQVLRNLQDRLMDSCLIQQSKVSVGNAMGTHLTLQAPHPTPPAIFQVTHPLEVWFICQMKPPTLTNKICATVGCSQFYMVNRQTFLYNSLETCFYSS